MARLPTAAEMKPLMASGLGIDAGGAFVFFDGSLMIIFSGQREAEPEVSLSVVWVLRKQLGETIFRLLGSILVQIHHPQ